MKKIIIGKRINKSVLVTFNGKFLNTRGAHVETTDNPSDGNVVVMYDVNGSHTAHFTMDLLLD